MAMKLIAVRVTDAELRRIEREAKRQDLSLGSYFRVLAGLPPASHGGARPNSGPRSKDEAQVP
jgi:hypothetical protein